MTDIGLQIVRINESEHTSYLEYFGLNTLRELLDLVRDDNITDEDLQQHLRSSRMTFEVASRALRRALDFDSWSDDEIVESYLPLQSEETYIGRLKDSVIAFYTDDWYSKIQMKDEFYSYLSTLSQKKQIDFIELAQDLMHTLHRLSLCKSNTDIALTLYEFIEKVRGKKFICYDNFKNYKNSKIYKKLEKSQQNCSSVKP